MTELTTIKTGDRKIEIRHPATGDKIGVRVGVVSIDDDRLAKIKRSITDRRLYLEARGKTFKAEEIEENKTNILFAAMTDWEWYEQEEVKDDDGKIIVEAREQPTFNGSVPDFNRRNVTEVFTQLPWFADQVNEEVGDTKAFFNHSKPN